MSGLTKADQEAFAGKVKDTLNANTVAFTGTDFDPVARAKGIEDSQKNLNTQQGLRVAAESNLTAAVDVETGARDDLYHLASKDVEGAVGALPDGHPLIAILHGLRPSMHHAAPVKPAAKTA